MAPWQIQATPQTQAALNALGPYDVPHAGLLSWRTARGFQSPWPNVDLCFVAHPKATDANYRQLLDAWQKLCNQQEQVVNTILEVASKEHNQAPVTADQIYGCTFVLTHRRNHKVDDEGYVDIIAELAVAWDLENVVRINLVTDD